MQRETEIASVRFVIDKGWLVIEPKATQTSPGFIFMKSEAPALIAFIQAWLDHDPEQELIEQVNDLRFKSNGKSAINATPDIIAAVREHDRKYGNEQS